VPEIRGRLVDASFLLILDADEVRLSAARGAGPIKSQPSGALQRLEMAFPRK
jgi:hypothetical protein